MSFSWRLFLSLLSHPLNCQYREKVGMFAERRCYPLWKERNSICSGSHRLAKAKKGTELHHQISEILNFKDNASWGRGCLSNYSQKKTKVYICKESHHSRSRSSSEVWFLPWGRARSWCRKPHTKYLTEAEKKTGDSVGVKWALTRLKEPALVAHYSQLQASGNHLSQGTQYWTFLGFGGCRFSKWLVIICRWGLWGRGGKGWRLSIG